MKILAVDTSAKLTSISVVEDVKILSEFNIDTKLTHSQALMPMLDAALKCAHIQLEDIDGFAVSSGPGSFTGLRIGIGAIKGLAYATNKPCVTVSTLEALAYNMTGVDGIVCATMDARCNQVYTAIFESNNNQMIRLTEDMAIKIDELFIMLKIYEKNVFFVGDGADLCYNKSRGNLDNFYLADASKKYQRAANVAFVGLKDFNSGKVISATDLMPAYLRLPQAQRELLAKKQEVDKCE